MRTRKNRRDTFTAREALTDNPFAAIEAQAAGQPRNDSQPSGQGASHPTEEAPGTTQPYKVRKTRKGGLPVRVEKRAGGKVVTIIEGIEGDAGALLAELRKFCGAGGTVRPGHIELQGDHRERVAVLLARC
jgi:translation initiation factor 1 (eIF-1/SUI1)